VDSKHTRLIIALGVRSPFSVAKMTSILVEKKIQPAAFGAGFAYLMMGITYDWEVEIPSIHGLCGKGVRLAGDAKHFSTSFPNLVDHTAFYIASQLEATGRSP
jgi:hypothetical protein